MGSYRGPRGKWPARWEAGKGRDSSRGRRSRFPPLAQFRFLHSHPELELQFFTGAEVLNLSRREADLAIRLVRPAQGGLKARKIGKIRLGLYGSAKQAKVNDLNAPSFVGLFESATSELEASFLKSLKFIPKYAVRSASWEAVAIAVTSGVGIGILPTFVGEKIASLKLLKAYSVEAPL